VRHAVAVLGGAVTAGVGALVLGEYSFAGVTAFLAGILYGALVSEVMLAFRPRRSPVLGLAAGAICGAGLGWAVWISSGRGVAPVPTTAWVAIGLGAVVAGCRLAGVGGHALRRRGSGAAGTTPRP
jgi:hypothetical protein